MLQRINGLPNVESSALPTSLPLFIIGYQRSGLRIEGYTPEDGEEMMAESPSVTPEFFDTIRIPLLSGRQFTERDGRDVLVINQTMARTYRPDGNALGARVSLGGNGPVDAHCHEVAASPRSRRSALLPGRRVFRKATTSRATAVEPFGEPP